MRYLTIGLAILAFPAMAANVPGPLEATTPQNIPTTANAVGNVFVPASTPTSVTVPYFADTYIMGGDPLWVCDKPSRCGTTFPTKTISATGWVYNPSGRKLQSNLQVSTSVIWVYARPQDIISGTNIGSFEWSNQGVSQ